MTTAPRRLDPRNEIATTPPLFTFVGIDEEGNEVEHPFPDMKVWTDDQTARFGAATEEVEGREVIAEVIGRQALADFQRIGGTYMMLAAEFKLANERLGSDVGESSGSAASSEASGATTSKPASDANTA